MKDGNLWRISPSSLYSFEECPACFWIEQHIGRAPSIPMRLNDAMDNKMKIRYDQFRERKEIPPEISALRGISLFPDREILDAWRNWRYGLRYENKQDGYLLKGALDEVLATEDGKYIPIDFKSSGDVPKEDKQKYYVSQLHAYALMLRVNGYQPTDRAYLVHYFTKDRNDSSLTMEFNSHLDEVLINLPAFENKMREIVALLNKDFPKAGMFCEKCAWQERRLNAISLRPVESPGGSSTGLRAQKLRF